MDSDHGAYEAIVHWVETEAPHGVFTTDRDLRILSWNRWLEFNSRKSAASLIGRNLLESFPELVERKTAKFYARALQGESIVLSQRFHGYLLRMPVHASVAFGEMQQTIRIAPLIADGAIQGTITMIEDVTERVAYEAELEAARLQAETANQAKDDFLALISHELRAPVASVLGWAHILKTQQQSQPDMTAKAVSSIERNAKVQTKLIEELLDLTRIRTGKLKVDLVPLDPLPVILAAAETVRAFAYEKSIRLAVNAPETLPAILGDNVRLQQVLVNVLSNAIKFTPNGGSVALRAVHSQNELRLEVQDTGVGIEPDFIPKVFEKLSQGRGGGRQRDEGLGLGLSLVKYIVDRHRGEVDVRSEGKNRGATFTIKLPIAQLSADRKLSRSAERLPQGTRIVVVDDNPDIRFVLVDCLSEAGAQVQAAASVEEGLDLIDRHKPDVLISDLGMPEEDGFCLIQKLRASPHDRTREVPAIALTAFITPELRRRTLEAGFQIHLAKPSSPEEIIDAVRSLLVSEVP